MYVFLKVGPGHSSAQQSPVSWPPGSAPGVPVTSGGGHASRPDQQVAFYHS